VKARIAAIAALLACSLVVTAPALRAAHSERVDLSVTDANIRDVLTFLAQQARVNLVMTEAVRGKVTVYLEDVRVDHAMDVILRVGGFVSVTRRGILVVMTRQEQARFW